METVLLLIGAALVVFCVIVGMSACMRSSQISRLEEQIDRAEREEQL